jgi:hypothetical protein
VDTGAPDQRGRLTAEPGGVGQQRGEPLYPPEDASVIDLDTAFGQQLLHIAVRQAVAQGTNAPPP